jgi:hypothetical protein
MSRQPIPIRNCPDPPCVEERDEGKELERVAESAAAGNSGRILTARSTAAPLAAVQRLNGGGQHLPHRKGEPPSSPTNSLDRWTTLRTCLPRSISTCRSVRRRAPGVIMGVCMEGLGRLEAGPPGSSGCWRRARAMPRPAPFGSRLQARPSRRVSAQGVAGLVTAGGRASWTTGELAAWVWVPATYSIVSNPTRPSTPEVCGRPLKLRQSHPDYVHAGLDDRVIS